MTSLCPPLLLLWIVAAHRLLGFCGGSLDYNGCQGARFDFSLPHRPDCCAEDGPEWGVPGAEAGSRAAHEPRAGTAHHAPLQDTELSRQEAPRITDLQVLQEGLGGSPRGESERLVVVGFIIGGGA